jgi:hypothetical protein
MQNRFLKTKSNNWVTNFNKIFNLPKSISKLILCEGLFNTINKFFNKDIYFNNKLKLFKKEGFYDFFQRSKQKNDILIIYNKFYKTHRQLHTRGPCKSKIAIKNNNVNNSYKKKIWISIGINNYKNLPLLKNAENDAVKLSNKAKSLNFNSKCILNENAQKLDIEKIFKNELNNITGGNNLIVISFHGHGITKTINNENMGYIVPFDGNSEKNSSLISINELILWTKYINSNHILMLLDSCFSGFSALRNGSEQKTKNYYEIINNLKNKIVINAGSYFQSVSDGGFKDNSLFTGLILNYLNNKNNQIYSVYNLYNYLLGNIPKYCNQTPTLGKLIGDQGGDIFLGL